MKTMNMFGAAMALAVGAVVGLSSSSVRADEPPYQDGGRMSGTFGGSIGVGHLDCRDQNGADCSGSGANQAGYLAVHGGVMLTPSFALLGDLSGMAHTEDKVTVSQTLLVAAGRLWLVPRLWVEGGLGVARSNISYDSGQVQLMSHSDNVLGAILGVGVELVSGRHFALDLELRGGTGFYDNDVRIYNGSLGVGVNWY